MALIRENVEINGKTFIHVYSDDDKMVLVDGVEYSDVYDIIEHTYEESTNAIEYAEEDLQAKYEALKERYDLANAKAVIYEKVYAYLIEKRDTAVLSTTKALYQAIIDLFESDGDSND